MAICHWPEAERPREKLIERGANALSDAELLAIFLRTGVKGKTALDLARELLSEFGDLRALIKASQHRFCQSHGLGQAKYVQLQAVMEMSKRVLLTELKRGLALTSPAQSKAMITCELRDEVREVFACVFLDNQHRVISFERLFWGTINAASVYPREVVRRALELSASAIIFAHNHPSGVAEPSQSDQQITQHLIKALALVDIRVLDHFVVGDLEVTSFAERGLL
jgi:DNA repair protein RadC